ncbi:YceI family protein [Salegentibacter sp. HM20]
MKRLLITTGFLLAGLLSFAQPYEDSKVHILPHSNLSIKGNTNINKFECEFNSLSFRNRPLNVKYSEKNGRMIFKDTRLYLENENFDCGNRRINKDFLDLLNTKDHPQIVIKLREIEQNGDDTAKVNLVFNIAGKEKNYVFPVEVTGEEELCFSGKLKLNIEDFGLEAPQKMMGLIVIDKEIEINFNLNIQS